MKTLLAAITIGLTAAITATAQVTITTEATMAPNIYGSPSWSAWAANATYAAENGLTSYGAAGPSQFSVAPLSLPVAANFVTGYASWMGQADPAAPYNNEYGTRASLVSIVNGNGSLINMNSFGITLSSSDPGNNLGVDWPNNSILPGDWTYDQYDIGLVFSNGLDISGGFSIVNSGDPGQQVNEIISIGAGNAYASYTAAEGGDDPNLGDSDQQILDYDIATQAPGSYDFTGTVSYGSLTGSATIQFIPEPGTISLVGMGLAGLLFVVRRRKS
ncbi:MAG TPA: PEP-CTERM sorting domain-containing protein [Verrucomicrobiae bacterium]|nr:PEP-CTERM sorting domain-containing protein [Verrucomicrobiae bacterium]